MQHDNRSSSGGAVLALLAIGLIFLFVVFMGGGALLYFRMGAQQRAIIEVEREQAILEAQRARALAEQHQLELQKLRESGQHESVLPVSPPSDPLPTESPSSTNEPTKP